MEYKTILEELLRGNKYLSLATADKNGMPWSSPVAYQFDKDTETFYFISSPTSKHIQNISENPQVAFSIFYSEQTAGNAFGIQGSGVVERVNANDIPVLLRGALLSLVSMVVLNRAHEFYALKVNTMFLPHAERWKEDKPFRVMVIGETKNKPE